MKIRPHVVYAKGASVVCQLTSIQKTILENDFVIVLKCSTSESCIRTYAYFVEANTVRSTCKSRTYTFLFYIYHFSPSHILHYNYNTAYVHLTMHILCGVHVLRTIVLQFNLTIISECKHTKNE